MSIANAPDIPGLTFRHFQGEDDYPGMASALTASEQADQIDRQVSAEALANAYQHLSNFDLYQDMILAEVKGEIAGYSRGYWWDEAAFGRIYGMSGFLRSEWRGKGIDRAMLEWVEERLRAVAADHPPGQNKIFRVDVADNQVDKIKLLEDAGYRPERYFYHMLRRTLDDIPDWPLPEGIEIRPVSEEQYRAIWECVDETARDEWGYSPPGEEDYQTWWAQPHFQPQLWQIAWDVANEHVVGHVLTYIHHEENEQFNRKRGYTEGIGVVPSWRRKGLARALIGRSLHAQKEAGMTESALVVDTDNSSSAIKLYESCGFEVTSRNAVYQKPVFLVKPGL